MANTSTPTNPAREALREKLGFNDAQMQWIEECAEQIVGELEDREVPPFMALIVLTYSSYLIGGLSGLPVNSAWQDLLRETGKALTDAGKWHGEHLLRERSGVSDDGVTLGAH